jgi:hypothetical protein
MHLCLGSFPAAAAKTQKKKREKHQRVIIRVKRNSSGGLPAANRHRERLSRFPEPQGRLSAQLGFFTHAAADK